MSHFIAKSIKHDKVNNTLIICGGDNNVFPRPAHYYTYQKEEFRDFYLDIMHKNIQLRRSSRLANKINHIIYIIEEKHKNKFPTKSSIDNYSFYKMSETMYDNKEERLKFSYDRYIEYQDKPYGLEYKEYFEIYSERWDEFREYIIETYKFFAKSINLEIGI